MESIFEKLWRFDPAAFVFKAIIVAVVADGLLLAFIFLRRTYRKRFFTKRDKRVFELRRQWDALISGTIPYEEWRSNKFDQRIVEDMALDAFEAAGPDESGRLLQFMRASGLIEKRIFEARRLKGWRRMRALVAHKEFSSSLLAVGGGLSVLYVLLAGWVFSRVYRRAVRTGLIARYSAETVS